MRHSVSATIGVVLAAILALSGLVISGILLQHHLVMEIGGDPILGVACKDVAGQSTCDEALASRWGKISIGKEGARTVIPTAMLGFVFFAFMSAWYITVGRPSESRRRLHLLPVIGAAVGALACVVLDVIMWRDLSGACWLCFATHVISWVLLLLTLLLWPRRSAVSPGPVVAQPAGGRIETGYSRQAEMPYPPMHLVLAALLLAVAAGMAGWSGYRSKLFHARWQEYDKDYAARYANFMAQPQYDIPIMPEDPIRGPADAPHTVVVFNDFQCPACRLLDVGLRERMKEFPGKFRIVFKYFPMDTTCNDYINSTLHPASCAAAVTAEAARLLGGPEMFWKMHDELFREQTGFARRSKESVRQACEKLGLDHDALWKKINTYGVWDHIRVNTGQGNALGVDSTPTLFFDGRKMSGWGDTHTWRFLIESPPVPTTQPAARIAVPAPTTRRARPPAATRPATTPAAGAVPPKPATRPAAVPPQPRPTVPSLLRPAAPPTTAPAEGDMAEPR